MPLYKFNSHPAPGYHADGSFITQDTRTPISLKTKTKVTADFCGSGGGTGGGSGYGSGGGGFSSGTGMGGGSGTYGDSGLSGIGFSGGQSSSQVDSYNPIRDRLEEGSIVEDWIPRDASGLDEMFKLMYNRDHIAGVMVDLLAEMLWSDFDLVGIQDPVILNIYRETMGAIDIVTSGPELTREFLVLGRSISSMIFDKSRGIFDDIISHDPSFVRLTPIPIKGFDPKIDLIPSPALRAFVESTDPRDLDVKKILPASFIAAIKGVGGGSASGGRGFGASPRGGSGGSLPLDPINTLFLPRRSFGHDTIGTSFYTRLITFWALEKALINASVASARRRIRSVLHVKCGIDNIWEPSAQEMDNIAGMFIQADEDPVGAVVCTRTGVDTSEIRAGQDFYKWADEWGMLNEGKLRALGANDALLCLSGDTLIPTVEHGIIRIDTFGNQVIDENLTTMGVNGVDTTKKWLYSGRGKVIELKTNSGNIIKCTPDHQILVLVNNDLVWKKAKNLKLDDYLCISKEKCTRQSFLHLNLITPQKLEKAHSLNEQIQKPETMTPDLAYVLGILVSEGCIDNNRIRVSNTDLNILEGVKNKILKLFGTDISITIHKYNRKDHSDQYGVLWKVNKPSYELCCWSKIIASYFNQLGVCLSNGRTSREKVVPWSILQADEESQLSYLAAYVDGDGTVKRNGKEVVIYSYSNELLQQTQIMLNSHGIDSLVRYKYLRTTCGNAYNLCKNVAKYSCSTKFNNLLEPELYDRGYGVITVGIRKLFKERYVGQIQNVGFVFLNDDGQEVTLRKFGKINVTKWKHLLYRSYVANEYDDFLNQIKEVSLKEYNKLIDLFSKKFKYTQLKSTQYIDEGMDVFDIQMTQNPSFIANGIIVHNSGDATYSNQESAHLFFLEKVSRLRETLTARIFYNKLFPLIARIHGFKKRTQAELNNKIRIEGTEYEDNKLTQRQSLDVPFNQLIMPTISWHKSLINDVNTAKLDVYDKLEEKGVPIHIRDWAGAGGVDLDAQMSGLETDADIRKQIATWKTTYESTEGEGAEESAKLEFVRSLRNLAHSNLKTVVGSTVQTLGPLASFIFWDKKAMFGPVTAHEVISFIDGIRPDDNSCKALFDDVSLKHRLYKTFQNPIKMEIGHYLIYRSGLTPLKPSLSMETIGIISTVVKESLDQYATHGSVYQLAKIAEKELNLVAALSETRLIPLKKDLNAKVKNVESEIRQRRGGRLIDGIANKSLNLYAGC